MMSTLLAHAALHRAALYLLGLANDVIAIYRLMCSWQGE
jgi:hypothetical protein